MLRIHSFKAHKSLLKTYNSKKITQKLTKKEKKLAMLNNPLFISKKCVKTQNHYKVSTKN